MPSKRYDDQFKIEASKLVREQGYTVKMAAQSLGVDFGSIRRWVREFGSVSSLPNPDATAEQLQRENTQLREENRRLLMEREILKKAATFFAKELT
jgi:transposase